jgi:hypothetical protein
MFVERITNWDSRVFDTDPIAYLILELEGRGISRAYFIVESACGLDLNETTDCLCRAYH